MFKKIFLSIFILILVVVVPLKASAISGKGIAAYPANPDPANYLTKSWFIYNLKPGESKEDTLALRNDADETKQYKLYPVDSTVNNVGGFALKKENDASDGIGAWIKLSTSTVSIAPGETKNIDFTISIPEDAGVGEHSGGIIVEKALTEKQKNLKGGFVITTRLGVRVYQTVPGKIIRELDFSQASIVFDKATQKYKLRYSVKNWGNITMEPEVKYSVEDVFFGKQDDTLKNKLLIPRESNASSYFEFDKPRMGKFSVSLSMAYANEDGSLSIVEYPEKFIFWVIPWTELIVILIVILANLIFLLINWYLRRREEKQYVHYKVKSGDDLEKIAEKFGLKWKKLAKINNLKAPFKLELNKDILVLDKKNIIKKGEEIKDKITEEVEEVKEKIKEATSSKKNKKYEYILIGVVLIICLVAITAMIIMSNGGKEKNNQATKKQNALVNNTTVAVPASDNNKKEVTATTVNEVETDIEKEEKVETAATTTPEVYYDIDLKILNGNGVSGAAGEVAMIFEEAGYLNLDTGNADHYGYKGAIIMCGSKVNTDTCQSLRRVLTSQYGKTDVKIEKTISLDYEVEIIIGAK